MQIKIKRMDSGCESYEISNADVLVRDLKNIIEDKQRIPADRIRLIFTGRVLNDDDTLASYSITDDSVLHMVVRPQSVPASQAPVHHPTVPASTAVPMHLQDLGNGVMMGSVTIDGSAGTNLTDIINQMVGATHNMAAGVAASTAPVASPAPPSAPPHYTQSPPARTPDSDIVMASAFLNTVDRLTSQDRSFASVAGQGDGGSMAVLLQQVMATLHGLQMPILRLSQQLADAERSVQPHSSLAVQTDVVAAAAMLRNLSLGASHAAAALEGYRVHQLRGAASPPLPNAFPIPHPGSAVSTATSPSTAPSLPDMPPRALPPRGAVPAPAPQPVLSQTIAARHPPSVPSPQSSSSAADQAAASTTLSPLQVPSASVLHTAGGHTQPTASQVSTSSNSTVSSATVANRQIPQRMPVEIANLVGSVITGVQALQGGNLAQGLAGLLTTSVQQHHQHGVAPPLYSSTTEAAQNAPSAPPTESTGGHELGAPVNAPSLACSRTSPASSSSALPSRADIGDIDLGEFDSFSMLALPAFANTTQSSTHAHAIDQSSAAGNSLTRRIDGEDASIDDILDNISVDEIEDVDKTD